MKPDEIRAMKSNLWITATDIEQVISLSSDSNSVMIAVNTTLELIAQLMEDEENADQG